MSRFNELMNNLPIATKGTIGVCVLLFVCQLVFDWNLNRLTMNPKRVLYFHEYYRIITAPLFHANLMHLGTNMMSAAGLSTMLERRLGTLSYIMIVLWSILLTSSFYIAVALVLEHVLGLPNLMNQQSVGFSGVLFHLVVLECNLHPTHRSVFGFFTVPSYMYPFTLLILIQIIMPHISFTGHLSGIAIAYLQLYGCLNCFFLKHSSLLQLEEWNSLRFLTTKETYIRTPPSSLDSPTFLLPSSEQQRQSSSSSSSPQITTPLLLLEHVHTGCRCIRTSIATTCERLQVSVFGRGHRLNDNIQLSDVGLGWTLGNNDDHSDDDDDDHWNGLPDIGATSSSNNNTKRTVVPSEMV